MNYSDFARCEVFFRELSAFLPPTNAPELHYLYAVYSEKRGRPAPAAEIYGKLIGLGEPYKDSFERLGNLQAVPPGVRSKFAEVMRRAPPRDPAPPETPDRPFAREVETLAKPNMPGPRKSSSGRPAAPRLGAGEISGGF